MNIPRIAGSAALGAAAILTLAGCIQLPSPQAPTTTAPTPTQPATSEPVAPPSEPAAEEGAELVDTQWSGAVNGPEVGIDLQFTFEEDGTLYITSWSGEEGTPFDSPSDTWAVEDGTLLITLSQIQEIEYIDLTGAFAPGTTIDLTGTDGVGTSGYTASFTQG
ncbi:hypothetical protein GCM10009846_21420 [Agrococcus versicolor]|uniref:Lipoprotein n=1 Tax=Agrococcus versicolor TaxID=501482 RepID=A0ABP5MJ47_9MICO